MRLREKVLAFCLAAAFAAPAGAQYFGKNRVQWDVFDWEVYHSPHFDIYFYPEERQHLERVASLAESAYLKVSSDLKHQIAFAIPLIYYKTHSEFEQTHLAPYVEEAVLAFAESVQNRMVMPIDLPADELQNLITHELTHIFEYSMLYQGLNSPILQMRQPPDWVFEGFSDFEVGSWNEIDMMTVRDMAITDRLPTIQKDGSLRGEPTFGRAPYNVGHAIFEFMESRWGMEGIRQFWWSLKRGSIAGREGAFAEALKIKPADFDQDFKKYMRERFKEFRTREIPVDYGRDISPQGKLFSVFGMALSPSGDLVAALTGNRSDSELDLILLSSRDGKVIKNLTKGYTTRYESIHTNFDPAEGSAVAWSRDGERIAFLARSGKRRSLFLIRATTGKIEKKIPLTIDEATTPAFYPDGASVLIAGLQDGVADLFRITIPDGRMTRVTDNRLVERAPSFSPDGKSIAFTVRIGEYDKIFVGPADNIAAAEQKTFGEWHDATPSFSPDSTRLYYTSSAVDGIYNLFTLDLETGERTQWTDVLGGNFLPLRVPGEQDRVLFTSYYRGNFGLYTYDLKKPLKVLPSAAQTQTQAAPLEFEPAVTHTLQPSAVHQRDAFKLLLAESRPLNVGVAVATDGSFYGGATISFTDMVADHNFSLTAYSVRGFRSTIFTYTNLRHRLQYQLQGFDETDFYYVYFDDLYYNQPISQQDAIATETIRGGEALFYYPFSLYRRLEFGGGFMYYKRDLADYLVTGDTSGGRVKLYDAWYAPLTVALTHETTRFKPYGPIAGSAFRTAFQYAPGDGDTFIDRRTVTVDARKYLRISSDTLFAARVFGFVSDGKNPGYVYFGGNNQVRAADYLRMVGDRGFFAVGELRFPFINAASSPIGLIGPLRGTLFFDLGYARFKGDQSQFSSDEGGFHLVNAVSSFGGGLEFFIISYPFHVEFVKSTDFQSISNDTNVNFWIGFDF